MRSAVAVHAEAWYWSDAHAPEQATQVSGGPATL
jgi:hypothetical protein